MSNSDEELTFGGIAKKGLGFLNTKLNEAMEASKAAQQQFGGQSQEAETCCAKCGTIIVGSAKFCPGCGSPMTPDAATSAVPQMPPPQGTHVAVPQGNTQRTQQYAGVINKCPNCGEPIDAFDAVCDACGFRIAGTTASGTVQQFYAELAAIEKTRKKKRFFSTTELDVVDQQKITLINTFPVPNTVGELSEFMFMAAESINVEKSKQRSSFSKFWNSYEGDPEKAVSDAWVSKMKQIYHKAKLSFSDDPIFRQIEQLYDSKMAELNMS